MQSVATESSPLFPSPVMRMNRERRVYDTTSAQPRAVYIGSSDVTIQSPFCRYNTI